MEAKYLKLIHNCVELYSQLLVKSSKKAPEAPRWAPFGEFAWASYREGLPDEEENDVEMEVYKDLQAHFGDYYNKRKGLPVITNEFLKMLLSKKWYKPVLHPPPVKILYRGVVLSEKDLKKYFTLAPNELENNKKDFVKPIIIPAKNGYSTSWSFKKKITREFSEDKNNKGKYAVTLFADLNDNKDHFLAGPGGLYDVDGLSMYHLEKETVGLEPIKIRRAEWKKL